MTNPRPGDVPESLIFEGPESNPEFASLSNIGPVFFDRPSMSTALTDLHVLIRKADEDYRKVMGLPDGHSTDFEYKITAEGPGLKVYLKQIRSLNTTLPL